MSVIVSPKWLWAAFILYHLHRFLILFGVPSVSLGKHYVLFYLVAFALAGVYIFF
jgi:hypothetical protein